MNTTEFRQSGKDMVDYICNYMDNVGERPVVPDVQPGYMRSLLPEQAPQQPQAWNDIMADVENVIMPGVAHWNHPRFHAYFPAGNSFPSIMGDMLSDALGVVGFSWAACPALTELEVIVTDWLAKMVGLPEHMLHSSGQGGGALQSSASDSILVAMLTARFYAIENFKSSPAYDSEKYPNDAAILAKLVAYTSEMAHSSVEKAGMVAFTHVRQLGTDDRHSLRGQTLAEAVEADIEKGLKPFFVSATIGTTGCCSFDNIKELAQVCERHNIWLHVDAAYGGSSLICPEFRYLIEGIETANSFNLNPNKWMLTNFDVSVLWMKNAELLTRSMDVNPVYLQHKHDNKAIDFRHWGIPLSRRFRALKLWFVIRSYGIDGLQAYIRNHVRLAKEFEARVEADDRFEIVSRATMGLSCFRLKGDAFNRRLSETGTNSINQALIRAINDSGKIHLTPSAAKDKFFIRFCVCAENATLDDIEYAWNTVREFADEVCAAQNSLAVWKEQLISARWPQSEDDYTSIDQQYSSYPEEQLEVVTIEEDDQSDIEKLNALGFNDYISDDSCDNCSSDASFCESLRDSENRFSGGVTRDNNDTLAKLRRQSILKMISDPSVYNKEVLRSLCFCNAGDVDSSLRDDTDRRRGSESSMCSTRSSCSFASLRQQDSRAADIGVFEACPNNPLVRAVSFTITSQRQELFVKGEPITNPDTYFANIVEEEGEKKRNDFPLNPTMITS